MTAISNAANTAEGAISTQMPWVVEVDIQGTSDLLFHRYSVEAVAEKAAAAKNSAAKKTDDTESYLYRDDDGIVCLPGEYLRGAICSPGGAAKYRQDPRSPRKSALDLYKAGVIALTNLAPIVTSDGELAKDADYMDRRRVVVQRNAVSRVRPAFHTGWTTTVQFQINTPEYISDKDFKDVLDLAGRLVGVGDFRPTFGRFTVMRFEII
jgi:hypothetical protein